jgi:uncharacterized delta-60 repeat protein
MTTHTQTTCWAKSYGGKDWEWPHAIQQTLDGGYVLAGHTYSFGAGDRDFWVLKADRDGNVQWQKTYGGPDWDVAHSIQQTNDGGYVVAGSTESSGAGDRDCWLLRLDTGGEILWQKAYGGPGWDEALSVGQTSEGEYLVAGRTDSFGAGQCDFWVLRLAGDGTVKWQKTFGGNDWDEARSIDQTSDGGYVVAGWTDSFGAGERDFWVIKLDSDGDAQWQKTYGGTDLDWARAVQQTSDDGFVVAGYTYSFGAGENDFWVLKLDGTGSIEWQKCFGGTLWDGARSIQQASDLGYVVAGYTYSFGAGENDSWVVKLDQAGDIQWQKTYGGAGLDWGRSIQPTADGGYVAAGRTESFGAGRADFWVLKLDGQGRIPRCYRMKDSSAAVTETTVIGIDSSATPLPADGAVTVTAVVPADSDASVHIQCIHPKHEQLLPTILKGVWSIG